MSVKLPTGNGTYHKLLTPGPWSVRNKEVKFYEFAPYGLDLVSIFPFLWALGEKNHPMEMLATQANFPF